MNSIDAIIAMLVLLSSFGLFVGMLAEQKDNFLEGQKSIEDKITAIECGAIIDSIFVNNAEKYTNEINCFVEKEKLVSGKKTSEAITKVTKEKELEVEMLGHYI